MAVSVLSLRQGISALTFANFLVFLFALTFMVPILNDRVLLFPNNAKLRKNIFYGLIVFVALTTLGTIIAEAVGAGAVSNSLPCSDCAQESQNDKNTRNASAIIQIMGNILAIALLAIFVNQSDEMSGIVKCTATDVNLVQACANLSSTATIAQSKKSRNKSNESSESSESSAQSGSKKKAVKEILKQFQGKMSQVADKPLTQKVKPWLIFGVNLLYPLSMVMMSG
jgi:hypothetical protein